MKQVTIQENSWHFKFSKWTYGKYYRPSSLCPYFWKLILALVISPLVLIGKAIYRAGCFIDNRAPEVDWSISHNTSEKIKSAIGHTLLCLIVIGYILAWIFHPSEVLIIHGYLAVFGVIIAFLIFIGIKGSEAWERYRERHPKQHRPKKEREPTIVGTAIKSWYHRNCPLVNYN